MINSYCGLPVIFCGFISYLIGRETINIPEIFSGVHGFTGKTNNKLDEVLLAIVYTVYSGNIITRSRLVLKESLSPELLMLLAQVYWYRDKLDRMQKEFEGQYSVLQHLSLKIVVFSKIEYRYLGTSGPSVSLISWDL